MRKIGKKIVVIGSCGSGKTTLCNQLSEFTGIRVVHLDRIYWKAGWESLSEAEFISEQKEILNKEAWIMDGNYAGSLDVRLENADTVIFLDVNRYLCAYRVLKRWWKYRGKERPDVAVGCYEKMDWSFLKFIWNFPKETRLDMLKELDNYKQLTKIMLRNNREKNVFINSIKLSGSYK